MESTRTLFSIVSVFLFIAVLVSQCRLRESIEEVGSDLSDGAMYYLASFESAEVVLDALEENDEQKARFFLYESASHYLDMADAESASEDWLERVESFEQRRGEAMQQLCSAGLFQACESLGHIFVERSEYDGALAAFTKSADNGSFTAMSAIVDLYRVEEWSGRSEEEARKWLMKIGKP